MGHIHRSIIQFFQVKTEETFLPVNWKHVKKYLSERLNSLIVAAPLQTMKLFNEAANELAEENGRLGVTYTFHYMCKSKKVSLSFLCRLILEVNIRYLQILV